MSASDIYQFRLSSHYPCPKTCLNTYMFLCAKAIMITFENFVPGLMVQPARIHFRLMDELPFMATEKYHNEARVSRRSRQKGPRPESRRQ